MRDYIIDIDIHVALYEDGVRVVGNFSDSEKVYEGSTIAPYSYIIK